MRYRPQIAAALALVSLLTISERAKAQAAAKPITLPLQGIEIDVNEDGSWKAIYATGVQAVTFPDARGVRNAYVIAEERAKAEIARYFEQNVQTGRIYTEAENTLEKTLRSRGSGSGRDSLVASASRTLTTSLKETFASSAQAVLRGVTILEQTYNEKREEVTVKVGISRETIRQARAVQEGMTRPDGGAGGAAGGAASRTRSGTSDPLVRPPSETRSRTLPTGTATRSTRPFTEARGFVRALGLKNQGEWDAYVKSGDKPSNIPSDPHEAYSTQWISWADWLGTGKL